MIFELLKINVVDCCTAKPQVSLIAPNHDHFTQVSLKVLDFVGRNCQSKKTNLQIHSTKSQAKFTDKEVI